MKGIALTVFLIAVIAATAAVYHLLRSDRVLARQAERSFSARDYGRAALLYRRALDAGPAKPELVARLAYSLLMSGRPEEAVVLYEQKLKRQPASLADSILLADGFSQTGRLAEARELYLAAVEKHPEFPSLRILWARTLVGAGHFEEAILVYKQVLGESP